MTKTTESAETAFTTSHHGKQDISQDGTATISWQMRMDAANRPKVYALDWNVQAAYTGSSPVSYRYKTKNTKQIASWYDIYVQLITDLLAEYPKKIKHGVY